APTQTFTTPARDRRADFACALERHSISGVVVDHSNHPLANITVTLSGSQDATATTGDDGLYSFTDLPAGGDYTVTPSSDHYTVTPSLRYYVFDSASKTFNNLSADGYAVFIVTPAFRSIAGRVTESGAALGGVTVTLSGAQTTTVTTDAAGNYRFANLWAPGS